MGSVQAASGIGDLSLEPDFGEIVKSNLVCRRCGVRLCVHLRTDSDMVTARLLRGN
jgi:hypothetical protein